MLYKAMSSPLKKIDNAPFLLIIFSFLAGCSDPQINGEIIQEGDRVFAGLEDWTKLYPGTVTKIDGTSIAILFDDGDKGWADRSQVIIDDLRAGDRVSCDWQGRGTYYPGRIRSRIERRIEIDYDDGDFEKTDIKNCVVDSTALAAYSRTGGSQDQPRKSKTLDGDAGQILNGGEYHPRNKRTHTQSDKWIYAKDWERLCNKINGVTTKFHNTMKIDGLVIGIVKRDFSEMIENGLPYTQRAFSSPTNDTGLYEENGVSRSCKISITVSGIHRGSQKIKTETLYVSAIVADGRDVLAHNYGYYYSSFASPNHEQYLTN